MNFRNPLKVFTGLESNDVSFRIKILTKTISIWCILVTLGGLVYGNLIYNWDFAVEHFTRNFFFNALMTLPGPIQTILKNNPNILGYSLIALSLISILYEKRRVIISGLFFANYSIYAILTYGITSGATTFIGTVLCYLFLFNLINLYKGKNRELIQSLIFSSIKIQISIVYLCSGLAKLFSKLWLSGAATYYVFNIERFAKIESISHFIQDHLWFALLTNFVTILFLIIQPFLLWTKYKGPILIGSFIFHFFIAIHMGLIEFLIFPVIDIICFADKEKMTSALEKIFKKNVSLSIG